MRVCSIKRVRVCNEHPIYVMDMSECRNACLVYDKQYQKAQGTYNFSFLLHVQILHFEVEPQR